MAVHVVFSITFNKKTATLLPMVTTNKGGSRSSAHTHTNARALDFKKPLQFGQYAVIAKAYVLQENLGTNQTITWVHIVEAKKKMCRFKGGAN